MIFLGAKDGLLDTKMEHKKIVAQLQGNFPDLLYGSSPSWVKYILYPNDFKLMEIARYAHVDVPEEHLGPWLHPV